MDTLYRSGILNKLSIATASSVFAFFGAMSAAHAEKIYTYRDSSGQQIISTIPPPDHIKIFSSEESVVNKSEIVASNPIIVKDGVIMSGRPEGNNGVTSEVSSAQPKSLYQYTDKNGVLHYTDKPVEGAIKIADFMPEQQRSAAEYGAGQMYAGYGETYEYASGYVGSSRAGLGPKATRYNPIVEKYAAMYNVDPYLIHSVIRAESAYNPNAVSHAGAVGLMQLMPATAKRFGVTNRLDPEQSIRGGTKYLRVLLDLFDNNITLVLAAYNAGEGAVMSRGNKVPNFPETQGYVVKVMQYYRQYKSAAKI